MTDRTPAAVRARRMLAILPHLASGAEIPLDALAGSLGAGADQLAEDIVLLSMCGAWPYSPDVLVSAFVEDDGVVRSYQPQPALDRPMRLTAAEARALATALEVAGAAPGDPLLSRLLEAAAPPEDDGEAERLVSAVTAAGGPLELYSRIAAAIEADEKLLVSYWTPSRDEVSERVIHPLALVNDRGVWYALAHCERAGAARTFRLDRIRAAEATGERFVRPSNPPRAVPFSADGLPTARIVFAPGTEAAPRDWPGSTFERRDDGAVIARVPYASEAWLARRVAARFGAAEVVSPASARDAVRALAASCAPPAPS